MSTCPDNVLLVDLQLDAHVGAGRQTPTKPGGQAIAFSRIRVIAADGEIGRTSFEGCLPALAQIRLARSSRVIEQADIGVSYLAVQLGRKAVGREVDHQAVVRDRLPDKTLGLRAIRLVIVLQYPLTHLGRRFAGRLGMETRMADGSIQVNEQTAYGGGHQRRCKCRCQRSCHDERAGIVAAVGVQQRLMGVKQVAIRRGNPVAAVLAGDHEAIACQTATVRCASIHRRGLRQHVQWPYQSRLGSRLNTCRVPSLHCLPSALKYASPSSKRRRIRTSILSRS